MEIVARIDPQSASLIEMNVMRSPDKEEFTRIAFFRNRGYRGTSLITIDSSYASLSSNVSTRPPETAPISIERGEPLELRVFIDKSVVEVFANGKQCLAIRVYPSREDSVGISFRSQGRDAQLLSLDSWQMRNIYE